MNCKFSETQYSFSFVFEILQNYLPNYIPFFPSTAKEGKEGFGYDVKIGSNLFFQFKVPDYIKQRRRGNEYQWNSFSKPFYRVHINTDGRQFRLLKDIKNLSTANTVFYAMPEFSDESDFKKFFLNKEIVSASALFLIEHLPNIGSGFHKIIYTREDNFAYMFSEKYLLEKSRFTSLTEKIYLNHDRGKSLTEECKKIIGLLSSYDKQFFSPKLHYYELNQYLIAHYGVFWIPILKKTTPQK